MKCVKNLFVVVVATLSLIVVPSLSYGEKPFIVDGPLGTKYNKFLMNHKSSAQGSFPWCWAYTYKHIYDYMTDNNATVCNIVDFSKELEYDMTLDCCNEPDMHDESTCHRGGWSNSLDDWFLHNDYESHKQQIEWHNSRCPGPCVDGDANDDLIYQNVFELDPFWMVIKHDDPDPENVWAHAMTGIGVFHDDDYKYLYYLNSWYDDSRELARFAHMRSNTDWWWRQTSWQDDGTKDWEPVMKETCSWYADYDPTPDRKTIFRLWSLKLKDHMFSTAPFEARISYNQDKPKRFFKLHTKNGPARKPLYRCRRKRQGSWADHYLSLRSDCEGPNYIRESTLGYIWNTPGNERKALYRCFRPGNGDHMSTMYTDECRINRYRVEHLLGYVEPF